jgi:hypothetical protein
MVYPRPNDPLEQVALREELASFRRSIAKSRKQAARGEAAPLDVDAVMQRVRIRLSTSR